jgi:hypothetical protein
MDRLWRALLVGCGLTVELDCDAFDILAEADQPQREADPRCGAAGEEPVAELPGGLERGKGGIGAADLRRPSPRLLCGVDERRQVLLGELVEQPARAEQSGQIGKAHIGRAPALEWKPAGRGLTAERQHLRTVLIVDPGQHLALGERRDALRQALQRLPQRSR